ncbi:diguanylate cyclase [Colwelliaceae bacterium 6471]
MGTDKTTKDLRSLSRSNSELKRALRFFIDCAPNAGPLAIQIENIKNVLKSNEAMFTFASLVEQYAKMKQNVDNVESQTKKKDLQKLKSLIKSCSQKNLSPSQAEKILDILSAISLDQPPHTIMVSVGQALEYFADDLGTLRESSTVIVPEQEVKAEETGVVATDVHLASKRLLKDIIAISTQLAQTYPNDKFIGSILFEAKQITDSKGTFFKSINLLERSTNYLALLIQQERCSAEEMLNDIHANIISVFKQTTVIEQLITSCNDNSSNIKNSMVTELKNMEVKAKKIDTMQGMQEHIKRSVSLMSNIMDDYAKSQQQIHETNQATISNLTDKINNTSSFVEKLEKQLDVAEENILIDELTTIGNRKGYVLTINKERNVWTTTNQPLTLLLIDVDKFKAINDSFGHSIGDQVLKCLGQTLKNNIRSTDYVARYGGEEFVIILPTTDLTTTTELAKKIRKTINNLKFELRKKNKVLNITCSFGISTFTEQCSNTTDVFNAADRALYQAKKLGRDAIVVASPEGFVTIDS